MNTYTEFVNHEQTKAMDLISFITQPGSKVKWPMPKIPGMSILSLPNGAGYLYLRMAFKKWMDRLNMLADHVILVGHLKDKMIDKKGKEVSSKDLDLTGKIKQITCANADAIGYIYRENDNTMISFNSMNDITAGSRCDHLKGQDMKLDWTQIFID